MQWQIHTRRKLKPRLLQIARRSAPPCWNEAQELAQRCLQGGARWTTSPQGSPPWPGCTRPWWATRGTLWPSWRPWEASWGLSPTTHHRSSDRRWLWMERRRRKRRGRPFNTHSSSSRLAKRKHRGSTLDKCKWMRCWSRGFDSPPSWPEIERGLFQRCVSLALLQLCLCELWLLCQIVIWAT